MSSSERTAPRGWVAPSAVTGTESPRRAGWGFATGLAVLLAVVAPIIFAGPSLADLTHAPVVLAWAIVLYSAARLWLLLMAGRNRPISLTFWLFVYVFFGLAALANVVSQRFPLFNQAYPESVQTTALLTILVGLAGYEFGALFSRDRRVQASWARRLNRPTIRLSRVNALGLIGLAAVGYFTLKYGVAVRFSSRQTATQTFFGSESGQRLFLREDKTAGLLRQTLDWLPAFLALYLLLSSWRLRRSHATGTSSGGKWGLMQRALIGALIGAAVLADNPLSTPRARFLGVALALFLAVCPLVTARRFRAFTAVVIVGLLFVYPYADLFRNDTRTLRTAPVGLLLNGPDFAIFQQEVNAQAFIHDNGHTLGRQLSGVAFGWVPKKVWPDKPGTTGALVFPQAAKRLPPSLSLWGFAYVDGGPAWVFLLLAAYGWLVGVFETAYRRGPPDRLTFVTAAVPLFAAFQIFLLRGDPQPAVGSLGPLALALVLVCAGPRGRRSPAPSGELAPGGVPVPQRLHPAQK